ncbi:MAG TPA: PKD domain-containing protein [Candidatus Eisenbacteria bacterium]|nr:PKD domain-containing protein [Candidatus Eisenbacteria bacterium]
MRPRTLHHRAGLLVAGAGVLIAVTLAPSALARPPATGDAPNRAPAVIDNDDRFPITNLDMQLSNHGSFARTSTQPGVIYPRGSGHGVIYAAGPWIGGVVAGSLRLAIGEYNGNFAPGPMVGGGYFPDAPEFRNYTITRGNTSSADFLGWPAGQGAPVDAFGNPALLGDAMTWCVYNDVGPHSIVDFAFPNPLGIEIQQSTFGFNGSGPLANVIFLRFRMTNGTPTPISDAYFSLWSDPDLGEAFDDVAGCDPGLGLGYVYNADNADRDYGSTPPATGFLLLQGPILANGTAFDTLGVTAFRAYRGNEDPQGIERYSQMRGLLDDGSPMHQQNDPALPVTTYQFSGDPVQGTGWLDLLPGDKRILMSSGPFPLGPGETQEIWAAVLVGQGADRLSSITALRDVAAAAKAAYRQGFLLHVEAGAPAHRSVDEGATLSFDVGGRAPFGHPVTLRVAEGPPGGMFQDHGDGTGTFTWTPDFQQAGSHVARFEATSDGAVSSATTTIDVRNVNRGPDARAGGPYTTFMGFPVTLDASATSDPDGDALTYHWDFGDETEGMGAAPVHTYAYRGTYGVALSVSDGTLASDATTSVEVLDLLRARAFTAGGNKTIKLSSGKPAWCLELEPVGQSFAISDVDLATLVMRSAGTGRVDEIPAIGGKTSTGSDRDGNMVPEISACFRTTDLADLFSKLHGTTTVNVTLNGYLFSGAPIQGLMSVGVQAGGGGQLAASVRPNPMNPTGTISWRTSKAGPVRVDLYDLAGRLVRRLVDDTSQPAGWHEATFDGRDGAGRELASGVYFYSIQTIDGMERGRLAILQ